MSAEHSPTANTAGLKEPSQELQPGPGGLRWREGLCRAMQAGRQFLWGLFFFEFFHDVQKEKARYSDAVNLVIVGELLGLPLMNSVITLRLLPYLLPELNGWKQRQLAEVDIIEEAPEIH